MYPGKRTIIIMHVPVDIRSGSERSGREAAIITGAGTKAFSAGADLKEWDNSMKGDADPKDRLGNAPAFKTLSRRLGKKPVIAAVNGLAMGAGTEFAVNW